MSSRVTLLLFLYGIPLSTAAGKKEIVILMLVCAMEPLCQKCNSGSSGACGLCKSICPTRNIKDPVYTNDAHLSLLAL